MEFSPGVYVSSVSKSHQGEQVLDPAPFRECWLTVNFVLGRGAEDPRAECADIWVNGCSVDDSTWG